MARDVVFDLDGTLIDSYRDIAAALNATVSALGKPEHDPEVVKTMIGGGVAVLLERGLGGADPELIARARARFKDEYTARLLATTVPYPGVPELLASLAREGLRLSVATNKPSYFTEPILRGLGLYEAGLSAAASADEAGARKPNPAVVRLALSRAGGDPSGAEAIYVGDMPIDLATAKAVPCAFIGVGWGFDPRGLRSLADKSMWTETPEALGPLIRINWRGEKK